MHFSSTAPTERIGPTIEKHLTTTEVSKLTGIAPGTLRFWRSVDRGPASFALTPKRVVYRLSELEKWIAAREAATTRGGIL